MLGQYAEVTAALATACSDELLSQMSRLQGQLDQAGAWDLDARLGQAMDALCCPPPEADVANLSGGERRRVAPCRLLLSRPDLLLLDEPTNHLDAGSVQWLEHHLAGYPGTVVAVTHDRYFLDNVAGWTLELDRGRAHPYEGNYRTYLETKSARLKVEGQRDAKLRRRLDKELEWVRSSPRARQSKSRARLGRYEQMAAEAASRARVDFEEIQIPPGPRLGSLVIEAEHLVKGLGGRLLIDDLSFSLPPNGIVGVIGPNGVGKTTLLKMITGEEEAALLDFPGCAVITSHDRWLLDRVATHILAWEGGADWAWFEGNFAAYEQSKAGRPGEDAARLRRMTRRRLTR